MFRRVGVEVRLTLRLMNVHDDLHVGRSAGADLNGGGRVGADFPVESGDITNDARGDARSTNLADIDPDLHAIFPLCADGRFYCVLIFKSYSIGARPGWRTFGAKDTRFSGKFTRHLGMPRKFHPNNIPDTFNTAGICAIYSPYYADIPRRTSSGSSRFFSKGWNELIP